MGFPGSIKELRRLLDQNGMPGMEDPLWEMLADDHRIAVQELYQKLLKERQRLEELLTWEKKWGSPATLVAGVDEAGRGPLAGPVTAAAVILDVSVPIPGLNDSKQLSPVKRRELAGRIKEKAKAWAVGWASVEEIDRLNIRRASLLAMKRAVAALPVQPSILLIDGNAEIPDLDYRQQTVVGGDRASASIAAASILAKVTRDAYMEDLHWRYPCYGFDKHKGYPTREHYAAIEKYGLSPVHRKSFRREKRLEQQIF
ncbi:MAG TPA: ribonuclease HII [Clostridia bacterium]|nr:ribonuclease HII [Clostridia bacterium]